MKSVFNEKSIDAKTSLQLLRSPKHEPLQGRRAVLWREVSL